MTNQCLVVLVELGIVALDGSSNVIASLKFDNAAKSNQLIRTGKTPDDFGELLNKIRDIDEVKVNDQRLNGILISSGLNSQMMTTEELEEIQRGKQALLIHSGFASDERDVIRRLRDFAIEMSSEKVKEESTRLDLHVAQAINALDETDQILNTVGARMREWYGLHFPELDNLVSSLTTYAEIIRKAGSREDVTKEILVSIGIEDRKADIIISACKRSRGGIITEESLDTIRQLAEEVLAQSSVREKLEEHVEVMMDKVAPNIKQLLTASVGARLIARAGGLNKLAILPASTIQVLGAEKALFRALRSGADPPKHGLLFQHAMVHSAPRWQRGKIARALASKLAIAARIDLFRPGVKDTAISDRLNARVAEIQSKYSQPSERKKRTDKTRFNRSHDMDVFKRGRSKTPKRKKFGKRRF